jgi:hypothetical protein
MIAEPAQGVVGAAPTFREEFTALRTAWINRNGFLYAYRFEVGLNLDLLSAVKRENLANVSAGSAPFAHSASICVHTEGEKKEGNSHETMSTDYTDYAD